MLAYTRAYSPRMTIASRLDEAMKVAGIPSQSELHRRSGVPQPTINRILKGTGKKGPEAHTIMPLAAACEVNFQWLFEGIGPMRRSSSTDTPPAPVFQVTADEDYSGNFIGIRMLKRLVYAGIDDGVDGDWEYEDEVTLSLPVAWLREKHLVPEDLVAFKASGLSMYPKIEPGTIVVANRRIRSPADGKLFAVNHNGKPMVKRMRSDGGAWFLTSDNPDPEFAPRRVNNDTRIIGRVIRLEMDFD
jgi:phage repressor protein C with HTH and peptisase S24 domain